jgi:acyl-coenzyme A thioesterase PaaI-like protein
MCWDQDMTDAAAGAESIQDRYFAELSCFGCGPKNTKGLQLKSFAAEDGSVRAIFQPWPEHDNGLGFLNGGIIATVLDCHSAAAVVVASMRVGLVPDGTLKYVTARLDLRFLRPAPLREPAELIARSTTADENQIRVEAELRWQDEPRATAHAVWKRWRLRGERARPSTH